MKLKKRIETLVRELAQTEYFETHFVGALENCLSKIGNDRKFGHIICYGLGTFTPGIQIGSRYQLALLILMHNYLQERGHPLSKPIEIFDPNFKDTDKETLLNYKHPRFALIEKNEYCARKLSPDDHIDSCVLFFMPHLTFGLYDNLIGVNWDCSCLSRVVVLGNSFHEMVDRYYGPTINERLYHIKILVNNFQRETEIKRDKRHRGRKKPSMSRIMTEPSNQDNKERENEKVLIESSIQGESFEPKAVFSSLSFHLINHKWLAENPKLIEMYRKHGWNYEIISDEDEW